MRRLRNIKEEKKIMNDEILEIIIWSVVILLVISILLFIAFRELMCWYWKINVNTKNISEINEKLSIIISRMDKLEEEKNKGIKIEDKKIDSKGIYG